VWGWGQKKRREAEKEQLSVDSDGAGVVFDWKLFEQEPLKSVDLEELKQQRTPAEVEALAKLLVEFKHLLSDGSLDFKTNPLVLHNTTAAIHHGGEPEDYCSLSRLQSR
jgi:hypothetical protein